jgi:hypothetical protein
MPLRSAQARLAVLPEYRDRDELGLLQADVSASLNPQRLELLHVAEPLAGELSGIADPVARSDEEKDISLGELSAVLDRASAETAGAWQTLRERWFERLLGPERAEIPLSFHVPYMRRLSPLEDTSRPRCVSRRSRGLGSTCRRSAPSGSTSRTGHRRTRAPA